MREQIIPAGTHEPADNAVRPFSWDDLEALLDARTAVLGGAHPDRSEALDRLRAELELPGADPEDNVFVSEADGRLEGCAALHMEARIRRGVGAIGVLPEARGRGIGRSLLHRLMERASEAAVQVLHVSGPARDAAFHRLMRAERFEHVRTINLLTYRPAPAYLGGDYRPLPAGYAIRRFVPGQDEQALADVQNAAFEGSWGFSPNTADEIATYIRIRGSCPEDIIFVVNEATGDPVGYIWTALGSSGGETSGMIAMTGVLPASRGDGIGTAVISAGLRHLRESGATVINLEVDAENRSARRIYRDLGFKKTGEVHWFEKRLSS